MNKIFIILLGLSLSLIGIRKTKADIFVVNSTADVIDGGCSDIIGDNLCTLREAIIEANANAVDDEIQLEALTYRITIPSNTETLDENLEAEGDFDITEATQLRIIGPNNGLATISGNNGERVLQVGGDTFPNVVVLVENVKITEGFMDNNDAGRARGAGIFVVNNASLTILNSEIVNNRNLKTDQSEGVTIGGGICASFSEVAISDSTIANNELAKGDGGGIAFTDSSTGIIDNSTISSNQAESLGGGILGNGNVTITRSVIVKNLASDRGGTTGVVNIKSTIIAGNQVTLNDFAINSDVSSSQINSLGSNLIGIVTLIERKKIDLKKFILLSFPIINPNSVILNLIQDPRGVVFEPLRH